MLGLKTLLDSGIGTSGGISGLVDDLAKTTYEQFKNVSMKILPWLLAIIVLLGMFYGIRLGINYAKAEEEQDKKKAKDSLINVIVGFLIAIVFVSVVLVLINNNVFKDLF